MPRGSAGASARIFLCPELFKSSRFPQLISQQPVYAYLHHHTIGFLPIYQDVRVSPIDRRYLPISWAPCDEGAELETDFARETFGFGLLVGYVPRLY